MNVLDLIGLASAVAGKQPINQTLADSGMLYSEYQSLHAGHPLDLGAMDKAGTLVPMVHALAREAALLAELVDDPETRKRVIGAAASL